MCSLFIYLSIGLLALLASKVRRASVLCFQRKQCAISRGSSTNLYCLSLSASVTLVLIIICIFVDARDGYVLNMSAKERAQTENEKLE